jgi:hypothetical protein
MAALTVGSATTVAHLKGAGVVRKTFTGSGQDSTEIAAAVTGKRHVIVGGQISCSVADEVQIDSAATVLTQLNFSAGQLSMMLPVGLETASGEALNFDKIGGETLFGFVDYITIDNAGEILFPGGLLEGLKIRTGLYWPNTARTS